MDDLPVADDDRPVLALLDGHSMAYRAFYALPETLATRTGQQTNAVYGFTSMLIKLLSDRRPDGIAVCFDQGRDERRTSLYAEYKAGRAETPDAFRSQLGLIDDVLEVLRIPAVRLPGVEADDVIATIATEAVAEGWDVLVVTGDRDAMQLSSPHVTVLYTLRGITEVGEMTPDAVFGKYGVDPDTYVQYAALRGDTSDNLPGVPKVGEKTAARLLAQFGSIEGIYEHLDEVRGKVLPANLAAHREQVERNVELMTLRRDVPHGQDLGALRMGELDTDRVRQVFGALEFRALYDRFVEEVLGDLETDEASGFAREPVRLTGDGLADWLDDVAGPLAVVPFTTGAVPELAFTGIGLMAPDRDPAHARLDEADDASLAVLEAALADPDLPKLVHDRKDLDHAAASLGWTLAGIDVDTLLAAYLLNPEQRSFGLEQIALQYLSRTLTTLAEDEAAAAAEGEETEQAGDDGQLSLGLGAGDGDDDGDEEHAVAPAADVDQGVWRNRALRAAATHELGVELGAQVVARDQRDLLDRIELPLAPVLARMERAGITTDVTVLEELSARLTERVGDLEAEVHHHAGRPFLVGSGKQLQEVLFDELELPRTKRIKTGWSTDAQQLTAIIDSHPIVAAVLEWREVSKLLSTYVDALPPLVSPATGRIHTTFSQTVAATGRLASSNPNLQNIPVRRAEGREIRRAFTAGGGPDNIVYDHLLVADYSQIELRIMAHLSRDDGLLDAFASGEDIHATTAAKVFDLDLSDVDGVLRDRAKAVNYGLAYGLTSYGLGQQLGIPPSEAQEVVDAYMDRFPGISRFLDQAVVEARRDGWTTTMFGRRRYLQDLLSDNRNRRQMAERMALNAPIQGTAADVIKLAMVRLASALDASGLDAQLLLQVHDEVVLEVTDAHLEDTRALVVEQLSTVVELAVPLVVDTADGPDWFSAQKH